ncbi:hypothetical protein N656DRAFT_608599 [Canariomyces notabilis]|uniref:Uncharacterized protein n=1 Tax=Canariomyces notabilis TaxID=2074819 RepID=A0AAN6TGG6_9PEZI|nr:hypothetical protein N656DRAFT_608599 [Canariomyces arenarius]
MLLLGEEGTLLSSSLGLVVYIAAIFGTIPRAVRCRLVGSTDLSCAEAGWNISESCECCLRAWYVAFRLLYRGCHRARWNVCLGIAGIRYVAPGFGLSVPSYRDPFTQV